MILLVWWSSPVIAQKLYDPNHPDVEAMVSRGISYVEANAPRGIDEGLLAALAIIETKKRYENEVPRDNPIVRKAVEDVLQAVADDQAGGVAPFLRSTGAYVPCLGVIVLCEVNDQLYASQINYLLGLVLRRQNAEGGFGYPHEKEVTDTSQGQYVGLALTVAKNHGFQWDVEAAKRLLETFCNTQVNDTWVYHYTGRQPRGGNAAEFDRTPRLSIHVAGLSSTYLLADLLNLRVRGKRGAGAVTGADNAASAAAVANADVDPLPPAVRIYVKPKEGEKKADDPIVSFDTGKLNGVLTGGTRWLVSQYQVFPKVWPYYYMYGFERYAFFRERSEGAVSELPNWYDDGVVELMNRQQGNGSWEFPKADINSGQISIGESNPNQATCLAILFLVRSSQILFVEGREGVTIGNDSLKPNTRIDMSNGTVTSSELGKGIDDVMNLIKKSGGEEELEQLLPILGAAIRQLSEDPSKSRGEKMAALRALVLHEDNLRRLVAVKVLAGLQDLDSVPALLFALTDPDLDVCREAHNGLRLISRKIDSFPLSSDPTPREYLDLKKKWTDWYLKLRPNAELMD
ncbi:MAG: HEAT repeat domain-containing protein [Planctomycetota bacterium]